MPLEHQSNNNEQHLSSHEDEDEEEEDFTEEIQPIFNTEQEIEFLDNYIINGQESEEDNFELESQLSINDLTNPDPEVEFDQDFIQDSNDGEGNLLNSSKNGNISKLYQLSKLESGEMETETPHSQNYILSLNNLDNVEAQDNKISSNENYTDSMKKFMASQLSLDAEEQEQEQDEKEEG